MVASVDFTQKHHDRGPSTLSRLKACPGSYLKSKGRKQTNRKTSDSNRGQTMHDIVVQVWYGNTDGYDELPDADKILIDRCQEILHSYDDRKGEWFFEHKMALLNEARCSLVTFGTPDAYKICEDGRAILIDWKMGFCDVDQPIENWQLASYSAMIMQAHGDDVISVESLIVQPFHKYEPYIWSNEVQIVQSIKHLYAESEKIDAPLRASIECKFCPTQETCEVFDEWTDKAEKLDIEDLAPADAVDYKNALQLRRKLIISREEGLKALAREYGGRFGKVGFRKQRGSIEIDVMALFETLKDIISAKEFLGLCSIKLSDTGAGADKKFGIRSLYARHLRDTKQVKSLKAGEAEFEKLAGVSRGAETETFCVFKD